MVHCAIQKFDPPMMIALLIWITLITATLAALMAWLNARQLVSLVMPDRLRIDLGSGRVVAVGQDFARRFGYDSARSCQRQFLSQAHFKNTSLYQMVAENRPLETVCVQDAEGRPINERLWIGLHREGHVLELSARDRLDARERAWFGEPIEVAEAMDHEVPSRRPIRRPRPDAHELSSHLMLLQKMTEHEASMHCFIERRTGSLWAPLSLLTWLGMPLNPQWIPLHRWQAFIIDCNGGGSGLIERLAGGGSEDLTFSSLQAERRQAFVRGLPMKGAWSNYLLARIELNSMLKMEAAAEPKRNNQFSAGPDVSARGARGVHSTLESFERAPKSAGLSGGPNDVRRALGRQIAQWMQALRVLIVEDDPLIADLLAGVPEALGATVARAETLGQAERLWRELTPDVLIVDGWLGDQSSADWVALCLTERPYVPIVLTTADLSMRPEGVGWVLEKPFEPSDASSLLRAVLNEVLAGKLLGEYAASDRLDRASPAVHE